jgi:hypothetical protein
MVLAVPLGCEDCGMRGDRVEIVVDAGDGTARTWEIVATRAGRKVEVTTARGLVTVTEVTRSGQPVRSGRFLAPRVVAVVEHPAGDSPLESAPAAPRRRARREDTGQTTLL